MTLFVRVLVPAALLAFAAFYYAEAGNIRVLFADGPVGPAGFPKVLAGALVAAVAVVVLLDLLAARGGAPAESGEGGAASIAVADLAVVGLVLLASALYVALFPRIGFAASTFVLSGALLRIFSRGAMGWRAILIQALAITAAVYVLFALVFDVRLPTGDVLDALWPASPPPSDP